MGKRKKHSIIQKYKNKCFLCHRNGTEDPLDEHHVFFGPYRKKSEEYGLTVYLCRNQCHIFGENAVHNNTEVCRQLQSVVQAYAMKYYEWDYNDFIEIFGRNYR